MVLYSVSTVSFSHIMLKDTESLPHNQKSAKTSDLATLDTVDPSAHPSDLATLDAGTMIDSTRSYRYYLLHLDSLPRIVEKDTTDLFVACN
jgi:hypothetical protein